MTVFTFEPVNSQTGAEADGREKACRWHRQDRFCRAGQAQAGQCGESTMSEGRVVCWEAREGGEDHVLKGLVASG